MSTQTVSLGQYLAPTQGLIEVQAGDVGEVGHARHSLQEPEALDGAVVKHHIQEHTQGEVDGLHIPAASKVQAKSAKVQQ